MTLPSVFRFEFIQRLELRERSSIDRIDGRCGGNEPPAERSLNGSIAGTVESRQPRAELRSELFLKGYACATIRRLPMVIYQGKPSLS